ncbi:hypothetical protein Pan3_38 [Pseudanabaena phage Pan3]|nr:hypothetical protein Pan3_38 [Pseudanabaena phage Pan3]
MMMTVEIDPRTGRPLGDHGTAQQAIDWALDVLGETDFGVPEYFLSDWREGAAFEEYPEFYDWLREQEAA